MPIKARTSSNIYAGFTLIELIFSMLIISILAALFSITGKWVRDRALFAKFMTDIREIKIGVSRFEQDVGVFPPDVDRGIDPGLASKTGWKAGGHSAKWETLDMKGWKGPYIKAWSRNPWGGLYDWDNYEPGYDYMGIKGGAVYVTLKPATWGGTDGLPKRDFEIMLEQKGIDTSDWPNCIAVRMGTYVGPTGGPH